jgi:hypothetical protein
VVAEIDGEKDDLALIDAVLLNEQFVGSKAIWDANRLRLALLTRADPAAVGISSLGGLVHPVAEDDDTALLLRFGGELVVHAPIAPGLYSDVRLAEPQVLPLGERVALSGPGVLAFDGERERVLKPGQAASLRAVREGPRVVDVQKALHLAACRGLFRAGPPEVPDGD